MLFYTYSSRTTFEPVCVYQLIDYLLYRLIGGGRDISSQSLRCCLCSYKSVTSYGTKTERINHNTNLSSTFNSYIFLQAFERLPAFRRHV